MDQAQLQRCVEHHGPTLLALLQAEQDENTDVAALTAPEARPSSPPDPLSLRIQHFIAKKADLLFAKGWKPREGSGLTRQDERREYVAVPPPLEQLMCVRSGVARTQFFSDAEPQDLVIGRVTAVKEFGFFVNLVSFDCGKTRDIEHLNITALCPAREIPTQGRYHQDPFAYYHPGDLIRALMKDVDEEQERLTISVQTSALPEHMAHVKLGVINAEQMPPHYRCVLAVSSDDTLTYEDALRDSVAFSNPACVEFLMSRLGVSDSHPPSLLRGLQSSDFSADDFATVLRQKQSTAWALKCVKSGVEHFKCGQPVEAMNAYNRALEMDSTNVEALVARGALFANKGSLTKAMEDLEAALEACPTHRNARKYLGQTLWQRGQQVFAEGQLLSAESLYRRALELVPELGAAHDGLKAVRAKLQEREAEVKLEEKKRQQKEDVAREATSAEKLRQLLHDEKRTQKKRKRSPSDSSSVITIFSDSSEASRTPSSSSSCGGEGGRGGSRKHKRGGKKRAKKKPSKSKAKARGKGKKKKSAHGKKRKPSASKSKRRRRRSDGSGGERRSHGKRRRPSSVSRRRTESESLRTRKESVSERSAGRPPRSVSRRRSSTSSSSSYSSRSRTRSGSERSTNGRPSHAKNHAGRKRASPGGASGRSFSPGPDRRPSPAYRDSARKGEDPYERSHARGATGEGRSPSPERCGRNKSPCARRRGEVASRDSGRGRPRPRGDDDDDACSPPPCTSGSFLRDDGRAARAPSVVVLSDSSDGGSPRRDRPGPSPRRDRPPSRGRGGRASPDRSGLGLLSVSYDSQHEEDEDEAERAEERAEEDDSSWQRRGDPGPGASRGKDAKTWHGSERSAEPWRRRGHGAEPRGGRSIGGGGDACGYWEHGQGTSFEGPGRPRHRSSSSLASGADQGAPRAAERTGDWKGEESRRLRTVSGGGEAAAGGGRAAGGDGGTGGARGAGGGRSRSMSGGGGAASAARGEGDGPAGYRGGDAGGYGGAEERDGERSGDGASGRLLNSQPDQELPQQLQDILGKIERFKRDKNKETVA